MMEKGGKITRILMVCHGNICRSPMAEFVMKDMIEKKHLKKSFFVASAATSSEEIGNQVHEGTRNILRRYDIPFEGRSAARLQKKDYEFYDYLIGMDERNIFNMMRMLGGDPEGKVRRLLDFSDNPRDIEDPWYTGDFDATYADVFKGCEALLHYIIDKT